MTTIARSHRSWFPYEPRPHQDEVIDHAVSVFENETTGLLAADCGVGKTIAVLTGYLTARFSDSDSMHLVILTRTHSQSDVFESELKILQERMAKKGQSLTTTSMVSRRHICPMKDQMDNSSNPAFIRSCARMIRGDTITTKGKKKLCPYYWNFYNRDENNKASIKKNSLRIVEELLKDVIVTRDSAVNMALREGICPYELLRWCAKRSRVIIGPYGYLFIERSRKAFLSSLRTSLESLDLIIDEAHNLASYVLDSESANLYGEDLQFLRNNKSKILRDTKIEWIVKAIDFLWDIVHRSMDKLEHGGELVLDKWDVIPRFTQKEELERQLHTVENSVDDIDGITLSEKSLDRLIRFLYTGIRSVESDDWHITLEMPRTWNTDISKVCLSIRPLNASGLTALVLRNVRSALLMSGTLRPLDHYAQLLGIRGTSTLMRDIPSPYPTDSQMIMIDKDITTRYKDRSPDTWRDIASRIRTALMAMPADKGALIAFPSYDMLDEVISHNLQDAPDLGFRHRVVETRHARIEELRMKLEKGPAAVFCVYGGKFTEGIDLVKNESSMINLIVGVGIPFTPPTSYQKALNDWYERRMGEGTGYYFSAVLPSVRRVAQLLGRLRRNPTDWGIGILLDERFRNYMHVLGDSVIPQSWFYSGEEEMRFAIDAFIGRHEEVLG
jgi:DNA excision repair protein ERCC-2